MRTGSGLLRATGVHARRRVSWKDRKASGDPALEGNRDKVRSLEGQWGQGGLFLFPFFFFLKDRRRQHIWLLVGNKPGARENVGVQGERGAAEAAASRAAGAPGRGKAGCGRRAAGEITQEAQAVGRSQAGRTHVVIPQLAPRGQVGGGVEERPGSEHAVVGTEIAEPR